jgi:hypothetical protein
MPWYWAINQFFNKNWPFWREPFHVHMWKVQSPNPVSLCVKPELHPDYCLQATILFKLETLETWLCQSSVCQVSFLYIKCVVLDYIMDTMNWIYIYIFCFLFYFPHHKVLHLPLHLVYTCFIKSYKNIIYTMFYCVLWAWQNKVRNALLILFLRECHILVSYIIMFTTL